MGHLACDPVKSGGVLVFAPPACHHLHADADAKEGTGAEGYGLFDGLKQAAIAAQGASAGGEGAIAWQHDAVGAGDIFGL